MSKKIIAFKDSILQKIKAVFAGLDLKDPAKRKRTLLLAAIAVAAFIAYSQLKGCLVSYVKAKHIPPKYVATAKVVKKDVPVYVDSFGNMTTPNNTDVRSQVTGELVEVHFKEGDQVKEGDILFSIDPSIYNAQLEEARASVAQDEQDLKFKKDLLVRNKPLSEKGLISQQDLEKLETDVASAEAKLQYDKASLDQAQINLNYCSIKAPITGQTGKRQVDVGNIVPANTGPVLVNIKTIDELYVDFTIAERDFDPVRSASAQSELTVLITPQYTTGTVDEGKLVFLDNAVNLSAGTVALRAIVQNQDHSLWPGQFVKVKLVLATEKDALVVPSSAVQFGQKGPYLFVLKPDNTADLRLVELGPRDGDGIMVKSGVQDEETVVTSGQLQLKPGAKVQDIATLETQTPAGKAK